MLDMDIAMAVGSGYGAILLYHIDYHVRAYKSYDKHFYDGYTWTPMTYKRLQDTFPYMKPRTIRTLMEKLVEDGYLIKERYNVADWDQTSWYAFKIPYLEIAAKPVGKLDKGISKTPATIDKTLGTIDKGISKTLVRIDKPTLVTIDNSNKYIKKKE